MTTASRPARGMDLLSPVWPRAVSGDLVVDHGRGAWIHTDDGRTFLDFTSGIGVVNTGHAHPEVVRAIRDQAGRILHAQANILYHEPALKLARALSEIVPAGLDQFFFANSGAEAVEGAVKLAKQATGRTNLIVFEGGFHGRTHLAMSMTTAKTVYRRGYQPLVSGVFVAPFPYSYQYGWDDEVTTRFCLDALERLLLTQSAPEETAAIVIEPVLGEGGYVVPPSAFLRGLREICDRHDILLIADEVQSGFGRTGRWFAVEHHGVVPDVLVMAKGMGSGMPISCVAAGADLWARQAPGSHGGTYGGNALACAAAEATIRVLRDEGLVENAAVIGSRLMSGLRELTKCFPEIGDVRGLGAMIGTEFTSDTGAPWPERARAVSEGAFEKGLLLLRCGPHGNVLRWIPPLVATPEEIDRALDGFEHGLRQARSAEG